MSKLINGLLSDNPNQYFDIAVVKTARDMRRNLGHFWLVPVFLGGGAGRKAANSVFSY